MKRANMVIIGLWLLTGLVTGVSLSCKKQRGSTAIGPVAAPAAQRVAWTAGRVTGSPEAPPPYLVERLWPNLKFQGPVDVVFGPAGTNRVFVVEQRGTIQSFINEHNADKAEPFADLGKELRTLDRVPESNGVDAA